MSAVPPAALGRDDAERRRAHLYAVIEKMIALEPQGFSQDDANIQRLCGLGGVSRAGYYRRLGPHAPAREDADLRDLIQRAALARTEGPPQAQTVAVGREADVAKRDSPFAIGTGQHA